jgi:hypothetical protein
MAVNRTAAARTLLNESSSTGLVTGESLADTKAVDQHRRRFVKQNLLGLALAPIATLYVSENA